MLKFAVFDHAGPARAWAPRHAHLLGPDDVAIPADISFQDGFVVCNKRISGAAALGIQVQVDAAVEPPGSASRAMPSAGGGLLTLRTCLLPERQQAYLLTLELARRQVMLLLNKLEEWALFDHSPDEPAIARVAKALESFTHALVVQQAREHSGHYALATELAAREALRDAVRAGEALSLLTSRVQHERRVSGKLAQLANAPVPASAITDYEARESHHAMIGSPGVVLPAIPTVGIAVHPAVFTPELAAMVAANCDFISVPMRWVEMEPSEGKYAFAKTDRWIEWAVRTAKMPVTAGPVLDLHPRCLPKWLAIWEHDYETLRDVIFEHLKTIVTRYRRAVNTWTIASGLHTVGGITLSPEQAMDLTRTCIGVVRKLQPGAKVQIEITQPWGEYTGTPRGSRTVPPMVYAELVNQLQMPIDAFAVRLHMGQPEQGRSTRDLLAASALLDKLAAMERPVAVSAFGVPSSPCPAPDDAMNPGHWSAAWTSETQALWLSLVGAVAAGKPYVTSLCWQELYDCPPPPQGPGGGEMPGGGLVTGGGVAKPGLIALGNLRAALRDKKPLLV